jgi:hypothetical protein
MTESMQRNRRPVNEMGFQSLIAKEHMLIASGRSTEQTTPSEAVGVQAIHAITRCG